MKERQNLTRGAERLRWSNLSQQAGHALLALTLSCGYAVQAHGADTSGAVSASLQLKSDLVAVAAGGIERGFRHVDTADLAVDVDLQSALQWNETVAHLDILANGGGAPNDLAGTLSGVNNGEAGPANVRLYQAWIEKRFGAANLRVGLSDMNTEFNVADSAGLLLGSSFGIGGEMAGTPTAAPSLYPSTALGARIRLDDAATHYWQAAVFNATPGVPGDEGGVDLSFSEGVMAIAEHGWTGHGKIAIGVWGYSRGQPDLVDVNEQGEPKARTSLGAYGVLEAPIASLTSQKRTTTGFLKVGLSDGRANETVATWQAGLLASPAWSSRPDSALSIGVAQAWLSQDGRANRRDVGLDPARAETQLEITYSDRVCEHLAIQPDVQFIRQRNALRGEALLVVLSLRLTAAF